MNLTNAIRKALKDAGVPVTLDELMEQLPDDADRHTVIARCRILKDAGEITASMEDGKLAYTWAEGRTSTSRAQSLTDRIREILRSAAAPLTAAEVCQALPDDKAESIQSLLAQRARAGEFAVASAGGRKQAYSLAGSGGVAVAVNVNTAAPAPTPAPPAPPAAPTPAPAPTAEHRTELGSLLDDCVAMAEAARETYVLSMVDESIYAWLNKSVREARAARDAFGGGTQS